VRGRSTGLSTEGQSLATQYKHTASTRPYFHGEYNGSAPIGGKPHLPSPGMGASRPDPLIPPERGALTHREFSRTATNSDYAELCWTPPPALSDSKASDVTDRLGPCAIRTLPGLASAPTDVQAAFIGE